MTKEEFRDWFSKPHFERMIEALCLTVTLERGACGCWIGRCDELRAQSHAIERADAEAELMYGINMQMFLCIVRNRGPSKIGSMTKVCPLEQAIAWLIHTSTAA